MWGLTLLSCWFPYREEVFMSSLLPVNVNGVIFQAQGEYTSSQVAQDYQNSLAAFANIFNLGLDPSLSSVDPNSSTLSADIINALNNDPNYATQLLNALIGGSVTLNYAVDPSKDSTRPESTVQVQGLLNVLANGLSVPGGNPPRQFMSVDMTSALNQLIATLKMAGVNIQQSGSGFTVVGGITAQMIENWKNLASSSNVIAQILQAGSTAATSDNRTLQALVELIYVKTGNELISNNLVSLQNALESTNGALNTLNSLQSLHNMVTAVNGRSFTSVYSNLYNVTKPSTFVVGGHSGSITIGAKSGIVGAAQSYFAGVDPTVLGTITTNTLNQFLSARASLIQEIQALSGQTPGNQQGTLVANLRTVLSNINAAFTAVGVSSTTPTVNIGPDKVQSAFTRWLMDSNMVVNTSLNINGLGGGTIQRNLTAAISSGQSLNSTQQQKVQQYLFVFEEYYKSASSILDTITQILQRMSDAMGR